MAVISYVEYEDAPDQTKTVYDQLQKQMGFVLNMGRALAQNPGLLPAFLTLNTASNHTKLDAKLRDLAYLKASQINNCEYCAHYHQFTGRAAGLTDRQITELADAQTSDAYDALQRDVIAYAEQVTRDIHPQAETLARLKESLSDQELMELTFTIGLANLTNRFNRALEIDLP